MTGIYKIKRVKARVNFEILCRQKKHPFLTVEVQSRGGCAGMVSGGATLPEVLRIEPGFENTGVIIREDFSVLRRYLRTLVGKYCKPSNERLAMGKEYLHRPLWKQEFDWHPHRGRKGFVPFVLDTVDLAKRAMHLDQIEILVVHVAATARGLRPHEVLGADTNHESVAPTDLARKLAPKRKPRLCVLHLGVRAATGNLDLELALPGALREDTDNESFNPFLVVHPQSEPHSQVAGKLPVSGIGHDAPTFLKIEWVRFRFNTTKRTSGTFIS